MVDGHWSCQVNVLLYFVRSRSRKLDKHSNNRDSSSRGQDTRNRDRSWTTWLRNDRHRLHVALTFYPDVVSVFDRQWFLYSPTVNTCSLHTHTHTTGFCSIMVWMTERSWADISVFHAQSSRIEDWFLHVAADERRINSMKFFFFFFF